MEDKKECQRVLAPSVVHCVLRCAPYEKLRSTARAGNQGQAGAGRGRQAARVGKSGSTPRYRLLTALEVHSTPARAVCRSQHLPRPASLTLFSNSCTPFSLSGPPNRRHYLRTYFLSTYADGTAVAQNQHPLSARHAALYCTMRACLAAAPHTVCGVQYPGCMSLSLLPLMGSLLDQDVISCCCGGDGEVAGRAALVRSATASLDGKRSRPTTHDCREPINLRSFGSLFGSTSSSRMNFFESPVVSLAHARARCVILNCDGTASVGRDSVSALDDNRKVFFAVVASRSVRDKPLEFASCSCPLSAVYRECRARSVSARRGPAAASLSRQL